MFSNAVKIDNLNDYNKESEECIKPFLYEEINVPPSPPPVEKPNLIHVRKKNKHPGNKKTRGEISLTDCLACSGCVTNEETTFLKSQNATEIVNNIKNKKVNIISLSLQSVVALSVYFNLPLQVTQKKLCFFFKSLNFDYVFDSSLSELITLHEAKKEFLEFFYKNRTDIVEQQQIANTGLGSKQKEKGESSIIFPKKRQENNNKKNDNYYKYERETERKYENGNESETALEKKQYLPLLCSHCSGAVIYGEKHFDEELLKSFSKLKSNQEIQGVILKLILLQKELSSLNFLKNIHNSNNFFKFCECHWNFVKACERHFLKNSNLLKNGSHENGTFSLDIFDINHVYLLYCFDKKIEAHNNYVEQQQLVEENVDTFLSHSLFSRERMNIEQIKRNQDKDNKKKDKKKKKMEDGDNKKVKLKVKEKNQKKQLHFVDAVLTTVELIELMTSMGINFYTLPELEIDNIYNFLLEYKMAVEKNKVVREKILKENKEEASSTQKILKENSSKQFINNINDQTSIRNNDDNNDTNSNDYSETLLKESEIKLQHVFKKIANYSVRTGNKNNISMGYGEEIFKDVCKNVFQFPVDESTLIFHYVDIVVLSLFKNDTCVFRVVLSYGLKSMHKVINKLKQHREMTKEQTTNFSKRTDVSQKKEMKHEEASTYKIKVTYDLHFDGKIDYVELMACEKGCLFGCAQNIFSEGVNKDNVPDCSCYNMNVFKMIRENKHIENCDFLSYKKFPYKQETTISCSSDKCIYKKRALSRKLIMKEIKENETEYETEYETENETENETEKKKKNQGIEQEKENVKLLKKKIDTEQLFDNLNRTMHDDKYTFYAGSYNSMSDSAISTFLKRMFLIFNKNNFHIFKRIISSRKDSDIIKW